MMGRVATRFGGIEGREAPDPKSLATKDASRDEAVTAVVSLPADDDRRPPVATASDRDRGPSDRTTGALHEQMPRRARVDSRLVGTGHVRGGQ